MITKLNVTSGAPLTYTNWWSGLVKSGDALNTGRPTADAQAAFKCPATDAMLNSVRSPMGLRRFMSNVLHAYEFTKYRIDRVPSYELIRCGLKEPNVGRTPYTGLPATGP